MPSLVRWQQELSPDYLSIALVFSHSSRNTKPAQRLIEKAKITFPVLVDGTTNQKRHGVIYYPSAFFLDSRGKVLWQGILPRVLSDPGSNRQWLDDLLKKADVDPPPPSIQWFDFNTGLDESQWTWGNRLVFIEAKACSQSKWINQLLAEDAEIRKLIEGFIGVKIDGRGQIDIAKKYGAAWPGDLVILGPDDQVLFRYWDDYNDTDRLKRALKLHGDQ